MSPEYTIRRKSLNDFELLFTLGSIILFAGAFMPLIRRRMGLQQFAEGGDPVQRAVFFVIYLITGLLILFHLRAFIYAIVRNKLLILLVLFAAASVLWSESPAHSARRSIGLLGTTLFGIYFGLRYPVRMQLKLLIGAFSLILVTSFLLAIFVPDLGIMPFPMAGKWRGVFLHKNTLGSAATLLCILILLAAGEASALLRALFMLLFGIALVVLFKTQSLTALISLVGIAFCLPLFRALKYGYSFSFLIYLIVAVLVTLGGLLVSAQWEPVLRLFGRDSSFTGRTDLWLAVIEMIGQKPTLGYGYMAFWQGAERPGLAVIEQVSWQMNHAHNGYMDIMLSLGVVGLLLFVTGFIFKITHSVRLARHGRSLVMLWPLVFLAYTFLNNLTEGTLLRPNNIYWILYASTCTTLVVERVNVERKQVRPARLRRPSVQVSSA